MHKLFDRLLFFVATRLDDYIRENHKQVSSQINTDRLEKILNADRYDEDGFPIQPCCPDAAMHCKGTCPR
jgi:hypothetical protein